MEENGGYEDAEENPVAEDEKTKAEEREKEEKVIREDKRWFGNSADYWKQKVNEAWKLSDEEKKSNFSSPEIEKKILLLAKLPYVVKNKRLADNLESSAKELRCAMEELNRIRSRQGNAPLCDLNELENARSSNDHDLNSAGNALNDLNRLITEVNQVKNALNNDVNHPQLNRLENQLNDLKSALKDQNDVDASMMENEESEDDDDSSWNCLTPFRPRKNLDQKARLLKEDAKKMLLKAESMKKDAEIRLLKAENTLLKAETRKQNATAGLVQHLSLVADAANKVATLLSTMCALSQAQGTYYTGTETRNMRTVEKQEAKRMKLTDSSSKKNSSREEGFEATDIYGDLKRELLDNAVELEGSDLPLWKSLQEAKKMKKQNETMIAVAKTITAHLEAATFLQFPRNKTEKEKYRDGVADSLAKLKEDLERARVSRQSAHNGNKDTAKDRVAPGGNAFETVGSQPHLATVFDAVAGTIIPSYTEVKDSSSESKVGNSPAKVSAVGNSPAKNRLLQEVIVKGSGRRHRRVDMVFSKDGRSQPSMHDLDVQLTGEAKSGCRSDKGPIDLLNEALDQILATMSKSVSAGFHFAQAGVPSHATAFIVNMALIQIFHLRLEGVGTPEAEPVLYKSKRYPLMSMTLYNDWVKSTPRTAESEIHSGFNTLAEDLYGGSGKWTGKSGDSEIPPGLEIFRGLLHCRRKDLFGPDFHDATAGSNILGELIGTGSQSFVFLHKKEKTSIVKLSKYGDENAILRETAILHKLSKKPNRCDHIPIVEALFLPDNKDRSASFSDLFDGCQVESGLEVSIGGVEVLFPASVMRPRGLPSLMVATDMHDNNELLLMLLKVVYDGISSALDFIHTQGVYHLDVNPSNIVVLVDDEKPTKAILIDFSIADFGSDDILRPSLLKGEKRKKLIGFMGTPNFTHRAVFSKYPAVSWYPIPEYDKASLGFSLSVLANVGVRPWASFLQHPTKYKDDAFKEVFANRVAKAREVIERRYGGSDDGEMKEKLLALIDCDECEEK
eukprot:scaffold6419_cov116-Cylindrotheca_fusiformis.AAC.2